MARHQEEIEDNYFAAQQILDNAIQSQCQEAIENAEENLKKAEMAWTELLAHESQQRQIRNRIDELVKEQDKRYKEAQQSLWTFNFDHAKPAAQQQMAHSAFFKAHNQFEGARTDEERTTALQDMQDKYSRMEKEAAEMPAWTGFIRSTAGAVDSDSIAAQELQERILNDFNKVMLDNIQKQTVIQEVMKTALQQMVQHTDPHNQPPPVGGSVR